MDGKRRSGERGASLLEILIALVLLGTTSAALLGAVSTVAITSGRHAQQSRAQNVLTSAAEALRDPGVTRVACPSAPPPSYLTAVRSVPMPTGWNSTNAVAITSIRFWNGTTFNAGVANCYDNSTNNLPLQLITIEVRSPDGRGVESVSVVKV